MHRRTFGMHNVPHIQFCHLDQRPQSSESAADTGVRKRDRWPWHQQLLCIFLKELNMNLDCVMCSQANRLLERRNTKHPALSYSIGFLRRKCKQENYEYGLDELVFWSKIMCLDCLLWSYIFLSTVFLALRWTIIILSYFSAMSVLEWILIRIPGAWFSALLKHPRNEISFSSITSLQYLCESHLDFFLVEIVKHITKFRPALN